MRHSPKQVISTTIPRGYDVSGIYEAAHSSCQG